MGALHARTQRMLHHTLLELYLSDTLEDGRSSGAGRGMGAAAAADGATPESVAAERQVCSCTRLRVALQSCWWAERSARAAKGRAVRG